MRVKDINSVIQICTLWTAPQEASFELDEQPDEATFARLASRITIATDKEHQASRTPNGVHIQRMN